MDALDGLFSEEFRVPYIQWSCAQKGILNGWPQTVPKLENQNQTIVIWLDKDWAFFKYLRARDA